MLKICIYVKILTLILNNMLLYANQCYVVNKWKTKYFYSLILWKVGTKMSWYYPFFFVQ